MQRGEIWWANLDSPSGRRPVVLLSRDRTYTARPYCTVATVSTRIRGTRSEVQLGTRDGLPRPSAVNLDDIFTIEQAALDERIAELAPPKLRDVEQAIHFALGLSF